MSAYQALYRKWRPMKFEDVVGQRKCFGYSPAQLPAAGLRDAHFSAVQRGTGKTSTAKIFSRAVNCESPIRR